MGVEIDKHRKALMREIAIITCFKYFSGELGWQQSCAGSMNKLEFQ